MGQNLQNVEGMVLVGIQFHQPSEMLLKQVSAFIEKRIHATG
jgi:hypothetical protein